MGFFHDEISSSSTPDAAASTLLLWWIQQACWMLPLPEDPALSLVHACMHAVIADSRTNGVIHWMTRSFLLCFRSQFLSLCLLPGVPSSTSGCSITWSAIVIFGSTEFIQCSWSCEFSKHSSSMLQLHAFRVFAKTPNSHARAETKM